jgi:crossover junction endodeoxyribonuclease RusA
MVTLVLPYPPSANRYWRHANNRTYVSEEAKDYKRTCGWMAREILGDFEPLAGPVFMRVRVYRPQKSGDLTNRIKVLEDALEGIAYINDKQIVWNDHRRYEDKDNPRVEVEFSEVTEW